MNLGLNSSVLKMSLAVLGSSVVLVIGFDYVTYAATGSSLLLGLHNTESTPTYITNSGAGSPLALIARSAIYPPFVTKAKGMVTNLNSNFLGGLTATQLTAKAAISSITYKDTATSGLGFHKYANITLPAGTYLATLNVADTLNTPGTLTVPNEMGCFLRDNSTLIIVEGTAIDDGIGYYISPTFSRVFTIAAGHVLNLSCSTYSPSGQTDGWTVPSDGFGPTLNFTPLHAQAVHTML